MYKITSYEYINKGKDKNLLFLHGWGCNYRYFLNIAKNINNANSILIDLPCFGNNNISNTPLTFNDYIDSILFFLKENKFKVNILIGHSFGGKLAISLANKIEVNELILFAPSIYNKRHGLLYFFKIYTYKLIKRIPLLKKISNSFGSADYKSLPNPMKKTMINIINYNVSSSLKKTSIPIIIVFGKKDKITPMYMAKKIKKNASDCFLFQIEGDHFAYLQNIDFTIKLINTMVNKL